MAKSILLIVWMIMFALGSMSTADSAEYVKPPDELSPGKAPRISKEQQKKCVVLWNNTLTMDKELDQIESRSDAQQLPSHVYDRYDSLLAQRNRVMDRYNDDCSGKAPVQDEVMEELNSKPSHSTKLNEDQLGAKLIKRMQRVDPEGLEQELLSIFRKEMENSQNLESLGSIMTKAENNDYLDCFLDEYLGFYMDSTEEDLMQVFSVMSSTEVGSKIDERCMKQVVPELYEDIKALTKTNTSKLRS